MYIIEEESTKLQLTRFKNMKCHEPYHTQVVTISIKFERIAVLFKIGVNVLPHSTTFHLNRTKQLETEANISPRCSTGNFFRTCR